MDIGKIIYNRRIELGLTLEEVGNYVGVGKSTVKKWESGYIENMKRDKIALLSEVLQLNPITFITGDPEYKQKESPSELNAGTEDPLDLKLFKMLSLLTPDQKRLLLAQIEVLYQQQQGQASDSHE